MTLKTYVYQNTQKDPEPMQNLEIDGIFPIKQEETPKVHFEHFHLCYRGDKTGNPLKVNIL